MQNQLLSDDDCACFLVEAIAQKSQNVKWETTVDKNKVSHRRIRRVSLDQFYALVTDDKTAFYKMCMALPGIIEKVVNSGKGIKVPEDTVFEELKNIAGHIGEESEQLAMAMAVYMLGFCTYNGFRNYVKLETSAEKDSLKRLYMQAKKVKISMLE